MQRGVSFVLDVWVLEQIWIAFEQSLDQRQVIDDDSFPQPARELSLRHGKEDLKASEDASDVQNKSALHCLESVRTVYPRPQADSIDRA